MSKVKRLNMETPKAIRDLMWKKIHPKDEYNDPVSLHNMQVLAAFVRGKIAGAKG